MARKVYNKLIRDRIPEIIAKNGHQSKTRVLDDVEFAKELKKKVLEEAKELTEAESRDDAINELSDIQELILAIVDINDITLEEIEKHRLKKLEKRGSFTKKLFLEYVDEKDELTIK